MRSRVLAPTIALRAALIRVFGWRFEDRDESTLADLLDRRMAAVGCIDAVEYVDALRPGSSEIDQLARELSITETYFLRNPDHFRALEQAMLEAKSDGRRQLRILSAGCASGAEAYSIAMVGRRVFEDTPGVGVSVIGVDVNSRMVEEARRGRYSEWALRGVPADVRKRYFLTRRAGFEIVDELRSAVRFEQRNLVDEDPVFWAPASFDVVFCRNVLMYFERARARHVLSRIARSLVPGGHLFLGHAENLRGLSADFSLVQGSQTFFYRRTQEDVAGGSALGEARATTRHFLPTLAPTVDDWHQAIGAATGRIAALTSASSARAADPSPTMPTTASSPVDTEVIEEVLRRLDREDFRGALMVLDRVEPGGAPHAQLQLLRAAALLAIGSLEQAEDAARRILAADPLEPDAHYVLGLSQEHQGETDAAAEHYRTSVYLDPDFALPHLSLGRIARRDGRPLDARREMELAARLLPTEDRERIVMFGGGFGIRNLVQLCESAIAALGAVG